MPRFPRGFILAFDSLERDGTSVSRDDFSSDFSGSSMGPIPKLAPFYVERGSKNPEYRGGITQGYNWQVQGYWYRVGLNPPDDNDDTTNSGTGTVPTANALYWALKNVDIGSDIYFHVRATYVGEYETNGEYEWRIARVSYREAINKLNEGPVRDIRTGSGAWMDEYIAKVTNLPVGTVVTVRIRGVQ